MNILLPRSWSMPDSAVTPESDYQHNRSRTGVSRLQAGAPGLGRRRFLKTMGLAAAGVAIAPRGLFAATYGFPAKLNDKYKLEDLNLTKESAVLGYNNFYEFSFSKEGVAVEANKGWKTTPWTVEIGGLVVKPQKFDVNELVKKMGGIEQRNYRHRCVEGWSMVIPWDGFSLSKLIDLAQPQSKAKYIKFTSFFDTEAAPGFSNTRFPWPYTEGLTMEEAKNELAFIATGIYGKPLANQNGAPIRLVTPWKYGFKSIKSIVSIEFVETQPSTLWNVTAPNEYGFYANVNPEVDHPRWSQATERVIGGGLFEGKKKTLKFNGYEKEVGYLYKDMDLRKNF